MLSQSDYFKKKHMVTVLNEQTKLPPILDSALCVEYGIIKKIQTIDKIIDDTCPTFLTCNNTNQRVNRKQIIKRMTSFRPGYVKDRYLKDICCDKKTKSGLSFFTSPSH